MAVNSRGCIPYNYIGGIPKAIQSSQAIKNCRKYMKCLVVLNTATISNHVTLVQD